MDGHGMRGVNVLGLTVNDATKDELIEYFFKPDCFGGGFRIPAVRDKFLLWLQRKRNNELLTAQDETIEVSQKYFTEYINLVKQMNDEPDLDRKLEIAEKANRAYALYEKAEKKYKSIDKKLMDGLGM